MSYRIYQTEALIVGRSPEAEASANLHLWTRELGVLRAKAQGVRLARSKLRYSLRTYDIVRVSLVSGKERWRVVGAELLDRPIVTTISPLIVDIVHRVMQFSVRLIADQEPDPDLYTEMCSFIAAVQSLSDDRAREPVVHEELLYMVTLLSRLGYASSPYARRTSPGSLYSSARDTLLGRESMLIDQINNAIRSSGL